MAAYEKKDTDIYSSFSFIDTVFRYGVCVIGESCRTEMGGFFRYRKCDCGDGNGPER